MSPSVLPRRRINPVPDSADAGVAMSLLPRGLPVTMTVSGFCCAQAGATAATTAAQTKGFMSESLPTDRAGIELESA